MYLNYNYIDFNLQSFNDIVYSGIVKLVVICVHQ